MTQENNEIGKGNLDNYESMFGHMRKMPDEIVIKKKEQKEVHIIPSYLPISLREDIVENAMKTAEKNNSWVLVFVIGTKPCYYKFYGSIIEAEKQNIPYIIINSNQHYDENLTHGAIELDYADRTAINLSIRGNLTQKSSELFTKIAWIASYLKEKWPGVHAVPVVLGDTIMCGIVPAAWMFTREEKAIHNEAGLRSMTPKVMREAKNKTPEEFIKEQFEGEWEIMATEPFPEQWDTFVASKASSLLFAPLEINKEHLLREGYNPKNIFVTGGVVIEALEKKRKERPSISIFNIYPQLKEGKWLRVDIHRKENQVKERFIAIINCMKKLVESGRKVCFIEMNTTKQSIIKYGLRQVIEDLKKYPNFLNTDVWPEYAQVLEFYDSDNCLAALTDSGGVQEEMNLLDKPCFTARFTTDRPETIKGAHSNLLVPPISDEFMFKILDYSLNNTSLLESMSKSPKIYGEKVAEKFIGHIKEAMAGNRKPFEWSHDELGFGENK